MYIKKPSQDVIKSFKLANDVASKVVSDVASKSDLDVVSEMDFGFGFGELSRSPLKLEKIST